MQKKNEQKIICFALSMQTKHTLHGLDHSDAKKALKKQNK